MNLYIIHGWAYSVDKWRCVLNLLKDHGIKTHMLNVPGLTSPTDKAWTIADYVEWLNDELKDVKHPVLLGHSNGGRIALNFDIRNPGKLKHLILLDTAGVRNTSKTVALKLVVLKALAKVLKPTKKIPGFSKLVHRLIGANDYYNSPDNMKQTLRNLIDSDKSLNLSSVTAPTSIIWGEDDTQTPISDADTIMRSIQDSKSLTVIKEARHAAYDTHPGELVKAVLAVLDKEGLR